MLHTAPSPATVPDTIRRHQGGGVRRIAESAGVVITHGEGSWLVAEDGTRYLDLATAMGVAAIGHAHPVWVRRVAEQAARISATVLHTPEHAAYLERLAGYLPEGLDRVALYSGGAEAVEVAVRLAQSATGKRHLISFTQGFHGKTAGVRYTGGRYASERDWLGAEWVHSVDYPFCESHDAAGYAGCTDGGTASLTAVDELASTLDGVAAVIVEPVQGTSGNRPPEARFLAGLRDLCTRRGWLLIADESITGFGRLGEPFGVQRFGVQPDILVLGKAMGGGFPLSGVAAGSDLWDNSLYAEMSSTSSSYGANPVACAAGLAVLDIVEEDGFLDNVRAVSARLAEGLRELEQRSPYIRRTRGAGMMLGFDWVDPASGEQASRELCLDLFRRCLDAGLLVVGDVPGVRLNPPLLLTPAEADRVLDALATATCR